MQRLTIIVKLKLLVDSYDLTKQFSLAFTEAIIKTVATTQWKIVEMELNAYKP